MDHGVGQNRVLVDFGCGGGVVWRRRRLRGGGLSY